MEITEKQKAYKEAAVNVKRIRNFYNHLQVFVIMMLVLIFFSDTIIAFCEARISNENSLHWVKANIWVNIIIWLLVVIGHGMYAYKFKFDFINQWEKKKVAEIMNKK